MLPNCDFDFPKSLYTVYDCLLLLLDIAQTQLSWTFSLVLAQQDTPFWK